jgi:hypothetical protein
MTTIVAFAFLKLINGSFSAMNGQGVFGSIGFFRRARLLPPLRLRRLSEYCGIPSLKEECGPL